MVLYRKHDKERLKDINPYLYENFITSAAVIVKNRVMVDSIWIYF